MVFRTMFLVGSPVLVVDEVEVPRVREENGDVTRRIVRRTSVGLLSYLHDLVEVV